MYQSQLSDFLNSARADRMIHPLHAYQACVTTVPNMHYQTACHHPVKLPKVQADDVIFCGVMY